MVKPKKKSVPSKRNYRFWRSQRDNTDLPNSWQILGRAYQLLAAHWRKIGAITLIYGLLYVLLVRVAPTVSLDDYREVVDEFLGGNESEFVRTLTLVGVALGTANQGLDDIRLLYGLVLFIVFSLVLIWVFRRLMAGKAVSIRDALYSSQTPLIAFFTILAVASLQILPFAAGGLVYSIANVQDIAVTPAEDLLFSGFWLAAAFLSGYWLVNTIMASYAVTLPGMYPMAALRATKKLVTKRRWFLLRKILFLPLILALIFIVLFLFIVVVAPGAVYGFIDLCLILSLPVVHAYYYQLYRSLV